MSLPSSLQALAAGTGTAFYGGLVVGDTQGVFRLVGNQVSRNHRSRDFHPRLPISIGIVYQVGRRFHQHQEHIYAVRVAVSNYVIGSIVDEGEAAVRFNDPGAYPEYLFRESMSSRLYSTLNLMGTWPGSDMVCRAMSGAGASA